MRDYVLVYINGRPHRVTGADAFLSLADFLRWRLRLTGTKIVCSEGDCGSCSVLIGDVQERRIDYQTVDACIQFIFQLDGRHIVTVEGLTEEGRLNAAQDAMVRCHGSQCGFCTPGFVVAMTGMADRGDRLDDTSLRGGLAGNLCRCTGYTPILNAGRRLAGRQLTGRQPDGVVDQQLNDLFPPAEMVADLQSHAAESVSICASGDGSERRLFCPTDLDTAVQFLAANPDACVCAGGTDVGVQINKRRIAPSVVLDLNRVPELEGASITGGVLRAGARATWSEIAGVVKDDLPELYEILGVFGGPQIRNVGTIGGNIANASPVADSLPLLHVCEAELSLHGPRGVRRINVCDFYSGYKQLDLRRGELIAQIDVPLPSPEQFLRLYRVSKRRDLDIAGFTAAVLVRLDGRTIADAAVAFGAVGPAVIRAGKTEAFLKGKPLTEETMQSAGDVAVGEICPISDVRGSAAFRTQLTRNILVKFWHDLQASCTPSVPVAPTRRADATPSVLVAASDQDALRASVSHAWSDQDARRSVGKALPHESATGHVTGQAPYLDDLPFVEGELHTGFVGSPVASGEILGVDAAAARDIDGVVGIFTADDVPGENRFGPIAADEPFLADGRLLYLGQPVAVAAAKTRKAVERACASIRIDARASAPILTIDEAIEQNAFLGDELRICRGDTKTALASAPHLLHGTMHTGGQEQFYLESQAAIAYPDEEAQLVVHSSTQNPTEIQAVVAEMLGLGHHEVVCQCKRMGGAFGGKETQASIPAMMAALVAHKTGRPARVVYNKDDDMKFTGKRHAYRTDWEVGFDDAGRILALDIRFFSDGGAATDLSPAVLQRTLFHADNAYFIPDIAICGRICFTNKPPNTAFRGFGGPQAIAAIENIMETVAAHLRIDALDVRERNLYGVGVRNVTPYGQVVEQNNLPAIFRKLAKRADYKERLAEVARSNAASTTQLQGLSITAVKFGISFTKESMNQANALVNVYTDGTVQVSTGGTEMGQGLFTKIEQIVADEFAIEPDRVRVMTTSTEKNNNTSPTAASAGTDLNGAAAVRACEVIKANIAACVAHHFHDAVHGERGASAPRNSAGDLTSPIDVDSITFEDGHVFDTRMPRMKLAFAEATQLARAERVSLGARGFYATPGIEYDPATGRGTPFFYYTQGAAVAEVSIDRFTGDLRVPRVDLLIDIGRPINPGVDRGQITGGFVQGMGWVTTEELCYGPDGELCSHSPTTYKIPAISDLPVDFRCELFDSDNNVHNIYRSKAAGEPPLMLGIAVWTAVKHALSSAAPGALPDLRLPATNEEILRCLSKTT